MSNPSPTDGIMSYPCSFGIKAFGKNTDEFRQKVIAIIQQHVEQALNPTEQSDIIAEKISKDGNYSSITVTIEAQSKDQLDAIYRALTDEPMVLLAL